MKVKLSLSFLIASIHLHSSIASEATGGFIQYGQGQSGSAASTFITTNAAVSGPLRVFILVGQSNMVGHGYCNSTADGKPRNGTLESLVENFPDQYGKLKNKTTNEWSTRSDVWIACNKQHLDDLSPRMNQHGHLQSCGYGGDYNQRDQMGPEVGFGWAVGDALDEPVLLLKVAWGGKSLAVDFRPPSSTKGEGGKQGVGVGPYYHAMIVNILTTISKIRTVRKNVEIAGFGWHQGWNDGGNEAMVQEYEFNLANLIRDVRVDLSVPNLPTTIAVSGMVGYRTARKAKRRQDLIAAQFAVANATKYPEFAGTVSVVETRNFTRQPDPHSPGKQVYHWNNNCESYWLIGQAMGEAMINMLLSEEKQKPAIHVKEY